MNYEIELQDKNPPQNLQKKSVSFINQNSNSQKMIEIEEDTQLKEKPQAEDNHEQEVKSNEPRTNHKSYKLKFLFWMVALFMQTIMVYIIKPLGFMLEIIFLTVIVFVKKDETEKNESDLLGETIKIIGWMIIMLFPLYHFIATGIKIVSLHTSVVGKIFVTILLWIEIITNFPLTFCYENNLYSIFLFEERGITQLLNSWIVFFPSNYIVSVFEIIRNFIEPSFFLAVSFLKYEEIKGNNYQAYLIIILQILIVDSIIKLLGNIVMLVIRIRRSCCSAKNELEAKIEDKKVNIKDSNDERTDDKKIN
jgi:hypothetical protein